MAVLIYQDYQVILSHNLDMDAIVSVTINPIQCKWNLNCLAPRIAPKRGGFKVPMLL